MPETSSQNSAPPELSIWFQTVRRPLPWRTPHGTRRDPWATLVSETMAQQTRIQVVQDRFCQWMDKWPTPTDMAQASSEDVMAMWAGLGYYARARNLHKAAQQVAQQGWPTTSADLQSLPGVGSYTAAAIASLCYGEAVAVIDGNVQRVLSRWLALAHDPRTGAGKVRMERAAAEWIVDRDAAVINEATMELGALVCTPRNPQCGQCPLADTCRGYASGTPTQFPPPRVRTATVSVDVQALVVRSAQGVLLRRARPDELLTGFWILPQVGDHPALERGSQLGTVRHAITHHRIVWDVYDGSWTGGTLPEDWMWCPLSQLDRELVSSLPRKALRVAGIDLPTKKGAQTDSV